MKTREDTKRKFVPLSSLSPPPPPPPFSQGGENIPRGKAICNHLVLLPQSGEWQQGAKCETSTPQAQ